MLSQITLLSSPPQPRFPCCIYVSPFWDGINTFCHEVKRPKPVTTTSVEFFKDQRDRIHPHRNY